MSGIRISIFVNLPTSQWKIKGRIFPPILIYEVKLNQNPKEIRLFDTLVSNYTYYESRHTQVPYGRFQKPSTFDWPLKLFQPQCVHCGVRGVGVCHHHQYSCFMLNWVQHIENIISAMWCDDSSGSSWRKAGKDYEDILRIFCALLGCNCGDWGFYWRHQHSRALVPWPVGPHLQLAPPHARLGGLCSLPNAFGCHSGSSVDDGN